MAIDPARREGLCLLLSELPLYQGGRKPFSGWQARENPHDGPRCPSDPPLLLQSSCSRSLGWCEVAMLV